MSSDKNSSKHPINRQIRAPRVRLVYESVNQIMSISEAMAFASERELDLVQFSAGEIPTCRVLDYSKYRYLEEKKRKQDMASKHSLKEIQIRPSISEHDLSNKTKQIMDFLEKGKDVRIRLKLKGREKANSDQHGLFLARFGNGFESIAKIEAKLAPNGVPVGGIITLKASKQAPKNS